MANMLGRANYIKPTCWANYTQAARQHISKQFGIGPSITFPIIELYRLPCQVSSQNSKIFVQELVQRQELSRLYTYV